MPRLTRRSFLAASALFAAARPAIGAVTQAPSGVEVVIIGAGAAGIAAARRIAAAGRRFVLIEAADHIGGRCVTDTRSLSMPFDRGAHWIYLPDANPLAKLAPRRTLDIYPAPASQKVRIGRRYAREGELEDLLSLQVRTTRAITDAARKADVPCAQAVPNDLGDWRSTIEFALGPYPFGKDLAQLSAADVAKTAERNTAAYCRQGFGTLLAALAEGIAVELSTPATTIDVRRNVVVETQKGTITARAAIVTVSSNVITSGAIKFLPELPKRHLDAFGRLSLGSHDHVAIEMTGNPLGLESDDLVFEKSADNRTAAMLANVSGTSLCLIEVAGSFGRDLSGRGEAAMIDFAAEWLMRLYGGDVKKAIKRAAATRWNSDHWTLGAFSAAVPGGQAARRVLLEPAHDAIFFAGEAAHETLGGTVGGAWESGDRAADAVLRRLGTMKPLAPAETQAQPRRNTRGAREEPRERPGPLGMPSIMREERR